MRLYAVEATPEEMERAPAWVRSLFSQGLNGQATEQPAVPSPTRLDPALEGWFRERLPDEKDERRVWATRFLSAVQGLGTDVRVYPGKKMGGEESKPYLYAKVARGRAFMYFRPLSGVARFDLPPEEAPDHSSIQVGRRKGWRITVAIADEESLGVGIDLARRAYQRRLTNTRDR